MTVKLNDFLTQVEGDDVCSYKDNIFKVSKLKAGIINRFNPLYNNFLVELKKIDNIDLFVKKHYGKYKFYDDPKSLFEDGVDISILRANSLGWLKGKLKINITLEFIPDEEEQEKELSPLDNVRQEIKNN